MLNRKGFTLIELLIVVVIIGILAAIAIPKFADNTTYSNTLTTAQYASSAGVTVTPAAATGTGWNATAWHNGTTKTCAIFVGGAAAVAPADNEGEPKCTT